MVIVCQCNEGNPFGLDIHVPGTGKNAWTALSFNVLAASEQCSIHLFPSPSSVFNLWENRSLSGVFFCVIFRNDSFLLCKIISTNIYLDTSPTRAIIITTTYKKHKVFFYFWRVSVETWCVFSLFSAEIFWGFTSRVFPWQEQKAVRTTRGTRLAAHRHHLRQWRQVLSWFLWEVLVSHSHLLLFPGVKMQVHLSQYIVLLVWNQP